MKTLLRWTLRGMIGGMAVAALAQDPATVIYPDQATENPQSRASTDISPRSEDASHPSAATAAEGTAPAAFGTSAVSSIYRVVPGDTLWKISRQLGLGIAALKAANGLTTDMIRPGQELKIPGKTTTKSNATNGGPVSTKIPSALAPEKKTTTEPEAKKTTAATDRQATLQRRFLEETRRIAADHVGYDDDWTPPGQSDGWAMDCSNTTRYLYLKVLNMKIPRTASDQYYQLQIRQCAWEAPRRADNSVDVDYLKRELRVGDLLFWVNTYRPPRDPPVTHVTIFLGTNEKGQWIMAGSQSGGGEANNADGGPDIYPFDPNKTVGGYRNWMFGGYTPGRFLGYGRPLALKF